MIQPDISTQLNSIFENRKMFFLASLEKILSGVASDVFIHQMFKDSTSAVFVPDRICELISRILIDDRESFLSGLLDEVSNNSVIQNDKAKKLDEIGQKLINSAEVHAKKENLYREEIKRLRNELDTQIYQFREKEKEQSIIISKSINKAKGSISNSNEDIKRFLSNQINEIHQVSLEMKKKARNMIIRTANLWFIEKENLLNERQTLKKRNKEQKDLIKRISNDCSDMKQLIDQNNEDRIEIDRVLLEKNSEIESKARIIKQLEKRVISMQNSIDSQTEHIKKLIADNNERFETHNTAQQLKAELKTIQEEKILENENLKKQIITLESQLSTQKMFNSLNIPKTISNQPHEIMTIPIFSYYESMNIDNTNNTPTFSEIVYNEEMRPKKHRQSNDFISLNSIPQNISQTQNIINEAKTIQNERQIERLSMILKEEMKKRKETESRYAAIVESENCMKGRLDESHEEIDSLKTQVSKQESIIERYVKSQSGYQEIRKMANDEIDDRDRVISTLKSENNEMKMGINSEKHKSESITIENRKLAQQNSNLNQTNRNLQQEIIRIQNDYNKSIKENKDSKNKMDELNQKIIQLEKVINMGEEKFQKLFKKYENKIKKEIALKNAVFDEQQQIASLQNSVNEIINIESLNDVPKKIHVIIQEKDQYISILDQIHSIVSDFSFEKSNQSESSIVTSEYDQNFLNLIHDMSAKLREYDIREKLIQSELSKYSFNDVPLLISKLKSQIKEISSRNEEICSLFGLNSHQEIIHVINGLKASNDISQSIISNINNILHGVDNNSIPSVISSLKEENGLFHSFTSMIKPLLNIEQENAGVIDSITIQMIGSMVVLLKELFDGLCNILYNQNKEISQQNVNEILVEAKYLFREVSTILMEGKKVHYSGKSCLEALQRIVFERTEEIKSQHSQQVIAQLGEIREIQEKERALFEKHKNQMKEQISRLKKSIENIQRENLDKEEILHENNEKLSLQINSLKYNLHIESRMHEELVRYIKKDSFDSDFLKENLGLECYQSIIK